jgi:hypothetical protein
MAAASASTAAANHSWNGYHWARTAHGFTLKVGDNVTSTWDPYLDQAIFDWSLYPPLFRLTKVAGQASGKQCRPPLGRIEVCNGAYGNNGWLGIASISVTSGLHIYQGSTRLNDTYFDTSAYNTPAWRRLASCQEIAHTFGLDHQDETFGNPNLGSCMDYTDDPDGGAGGAVNNDPTNEYPNLHDYVELFIVYGSHLDATTTVGALVPEDAKPSRVERSDRISDSTIVEHFRNGTQRVTHVIWAIGSPRAHLEH